MKPQRLGVVYSGFGADEIAGFVVLFDGVAPEPVLDARIIVIQSPEGLGRRSAMEPTAEDLGNGLGQPARIACGKGAAGGSETLELVQEPFKEMGAKTRGPKHHVGRDLDLAQVVSERKPGFFVKIKEDQNFNRRNILNISRIKIFI